MKTLKFILVLFLFVITARLSGDIVKKHTQPQIRVMITNLDNFPDIAVIGLSDCLAFSRSNKAYIVKSGSCLQIYQACPLTLYAVKKKYLEKKDLGEIDWENDKNVIKSNLTINLKTFNRLEPRNTVEIDFNIAGFSDRSMVLYRAKQIFKNSDRPDSVHVFNYEGDRSKLHHDFK